MNSMIVSKNIQTSGLSKRPFWDVDFESLDPERDSLFIVEKVFNYGLWEDYRTVFALYGTARIRRDIVSVSYLSATSLAAHPQSGHPS